MAIYLAFYNDNSYENAAEAHKRGGLYRQADDISGGRTALLDALSAAQAAIKCSGMDIIAVYTDQDCKTFNDPYDYQD